MLSQYSLFQLDNELKVITVPIKGISSATVLVFVGAGSRYEQKDKAGLSHFLEHMIFKGTKKRPSAFDISCLVDSVGGENNAFTGKDRTGFYIKLQVNQLELAFDVLSDTLLNSLFDQVEIDRERGTIIEEINLYEDTPIYAIDEVFYSLLYDGHPLGWPISGSKPTVKNINRQDFVDYCSRFYQGKDMVLVVAGGVEEKEVKRLSEKYFSSLVPGKKEDILKFVENQKAPCVKIKTKQTDQVHLYLGYPAFSLFDEDRDVLSVIEAILGEGMSSRLFIQVRERRGLAYYVKTDCDLHHETGYFAARAGLNIDKIDEAIKVILEEFEKVKTGDVTEEELRKAKEFIKGRTALSLEDSLEVAEWYAEKQLFLGKIETPDDDFARIDKVSLEDIKRVAQRIFKKEKLNLAMIGPITSEERFLKLIS